LIPTWFLYVENIDVNAVISENALSATTIIHYDVDYYADR